MSKYGSYLMQVTVTFFKGPFTVNFDVLEKWTKTKTEHICMFVFFFQCLLTTGIKQEAK